MLYYYDSQSLNSSCLLKNKLQEMISNYRFPEQQIVILCIGSDRSTGDSLGPMIGYKLKKSSNDSFYVYGDLHHPVHAINLSKCIKSIYETFSNPFIIAIDASLGKAEHIGFITLSEGPLRPGLGVKKKLPEVGNIHITGIVNSSDNTDFSILQTTRLSTIMHIADVIYSALISINDDSYKLKVPVRLYQPHLILEENVVL